VALAEGCVEFCEWIGIKDFTKIDAQVGGREAGGAEAVFFMCGEWVRLFSRTECR
jgi:hypothetical protein